LSAWRRVTDASLVRAARRGSEEAMAELFERHWPLMHRAALLITGDAAAAEDIAQEAFLSAIRALDRFDMRRPLGPWLHRIATNRAIDWSRARALRREVSDAGEVEPAASVVEGMDEELLAALQTLGVEQRAVVVLRYVLDLTPGEIAQRLDLPRGTVNSRLRRGLDALGERLR
jgi:RNA polymerase sigma-70 factor, ECF subfamily